MRIYCLRPSLPLGNQRGSGELHEKKNTDVFARGGCPATPPSPPPRHPNCTLTVCCSPFGLQPLACFSARLPVSLGSARHFERFAYVSLPLWGCVSRKSSVLPGNGCRIVGRQVQCAVNSSTSGFVHVHVRVCVFKHSLRESCSDCLSRCGPKHNASARLPWIHTHASFLPITTLTLLQSGAGRYSHGKEESAQLGDRAES